METKVKLSRAGVRAMFKSGEVQSLLLGQANRIRKSAESDLTKNSQTQLSRKQKVVRFIKGTGTNYGTVTYIGKVSAHARVYTRSQHAKNAEKTRNVLENTLSK